MAYHLTDPQHLELTVCGVTGGFRTEQFNDLTCNECKKWMHDATVAALDAAHAEVEEWKALSAPGPLTADEALCVVPKCPSCGTHTAPEPTSSKAMWRCPTCRDRFSEPENKENPNG